MHLFRISFERPTILIALWPLFSTLFDSVHASSDEADCLSYQPLDIPNTSLLNATWYPANADISLVNPAINFTTNSLPAFCRLVFSVTTNATAESHATSEVWLPPSQEWNGRYLQIGVGGHMGGGASVFCYS